MLMRVNQEVKNKQKKQKQKLKEANMVDPW